MKFKLFNLLTVFLATSGLLTPAQAAVVDHSLERQIATQSYKSSPVTVVPPLVSPAQQKSIADILLVLIYFVLPGGLVLGMFLYDKYYIYRAGVIQEQIDLLERLYACDHNATTNTGQGANERIERLERLWQSDSDNDATTDTGQGAKG